MILKPLLLAIMVGIGSVCLSGCASVFDPLAGSAQKDDPVSTQLAEAAVSVSNSFRTLAQVEQATNPQAVPEPPIPPEEYGMEQLASVEWSGPAEPLLGKIAEATGYKLKVLGHEPSIPVLVTISAVNTPLGDILRDIGFQTGTRAKVVLYPTRQVIEVRYATS